MRFKDVRNGQFFTDIETGVLYRKSMTAGSESAIDVSKGVVIPIERLAKVKVVDATFEQFDTLITDRERTYLEAVLDPFKDKVEFVAKLAMESGKVHLGVAMSDDTCMSFPAFDPDNPMYEGMETNQRYTVSELGLWGEPRETVHSNWEIPAFVG